MERVNLGLSWRDADRVERHSAQEREVISKRSWFETLHIKLRPHGTLVNPLLQQSNLILREWGAFGWHDDVGVFRGYPIDQRTRGRLSKNDGGLTGFAPLQDGRVFVNPQTALCFAALVTVVASRLQQRLDVLEIVDSALAALVGISGNARDSSGNEMIDLVVGWKAFDLLRHGDWFDTGQPLRGGTAAFAPVIAVGIAAVGSGVCIDLNEPLSALSYISGPAIVGISHLAFARRKQRP